MTAIEASSARCKTMADGTLQLTVNIEPRDAFQAWLFESITAGQPIPRARDLKAWAKNEQRKAEQEEAAQQQKWANLIGKADSPNQG